MGGARQGDAAQGRHPGAFWEEYRAAHPDGFGYSWFCEQYGAFKSRLRPSMRQSHAAGEKVFVDFAGDTIDVIDPSTGEVRPMKLFVAAMGASSYIFSPGAADEQIADWIGAHVDLLAFLGGAPKSWSATISRPRSPTRTARAGPEPQLSGVRRPLRRGDPPARPSTRATRPRSSSRSCSPSAGFWPGCATGASSAPPISTPRSPEHVGDINVRVDEGLRREPGRTLRPRWTPRR